jgi:predicted nucleic-acid-binding protein
VSAINEHDRVVLTFDVAEGKLAVGDVGNVVQTYRAGNTFDVEFVSLNGETIAIVRRCANTGKGRADFADYSIAAINEAEGCEATYTFDRRAARSEWHRPAL